MSALKRKKKKENHIKVLNIKMHFIKTGTNKMLKLMIFTEVLISLTPMSEPSRTSTNRQSSGGKKGYTCKRAKDQTILKCW